MGVGPGAAWITARDASTGIRGFARITVARVPTLTITPASGPPSTAVQISAVKFQPGTKIVVVYLAGTTALRLCGATVAPDGSFQCTGSVPDKAHAGTIGQHAIVAKGWPSHKVTTTFTLTS
jgi:hypothetical protein